LWGFLNVNKPPGLTSHDVVAKVRRTLNLKKVGHAGTLDPMATGVLILCVGAATRLSEYVMQSSKRYQARVHLGVTTDTYDAEGVVQRGRDATTIRLEDVEHEISAFEGNIEQTPPMYSAIKQGGRKLYKLARAGQTVEREARSVTIERLEIVDWSPPEFTLDVTCSAGTYIRSLAHDLGEVLGVGAHLAGLVRVASGYFTLDNAVALDALLAADDWPQYLIPIQAALADWPAVQLDAADAEHIKHGRSINNGGEVGKQLALAFMPGGDFIAVLRSELGQWQPEKVFLPEICHDVDDGLQ
jgi:tRNA pseudouridine55 synthase